MMLPYSNNYILLSHTPLKIHTHTHTQKKLLPSFWALTCTLVDNFTKPIYVCLPSQFNKINVPTHHWVPTSPLLGRFNRTHEKKFPLIAPKRMCDVFRVTHHSIVNNLVCLEYCIWIHIFLWEYSIHINICMYATKL
jgi:hypothetical protein